MLLYNSQVSGNCYKVRLLLAHLGRDYERRELDVIDRSDRAEILGDLNPALRVPTLVVDDGEPGTRGRLRPLPIRRDPRLARAGRGAAAPRSDHRVSGPHSHEELRKRRTA
ncbi:MAG TPA: glutathione S-transferase N-terminal domain-containing protein [Solirubrobacteraceae bacterium]|nr:glutathione S-transferase N-terminal domain-containing protein [Solirubrobacteraceae bacterium]